MHSTTSKPTTDAALAAPVIPVTDRGLSPFAAVAAGQSGSVAPIRVIACPYCRGSGWSPLVYSDANGYEQGERCTWCAGTGSTTTEEIDL